MEARYAVALTAGSDEPIGWLTLDEPVTRTAFGVEDFALFKTLGDQSAATVENRRLTEELSRAKEMETFQTLSTFFVHDLKNLASRLSLVLQNLPTHYDNPEFRRDLLDTMSKSVAKIESMTTRLSSISKGMELEPSRCDVNALVSDTLEALSASMQASVSEELQELPQVDLDRNQIRKVLTNLVLNAQEATGPSGSIWVCTSRENGWVALSVRDDGCGMSDEFLTQQLFKPFQTTKKQGLGIGLFHSKKIVEAHGGRIEVESADGEGSVFRVLLPRRGARSRGTRDDQTEAIDRRRCRRHQDADEVGALGGLRGRRGRGPKERHVVVRGAPPAAGDSRSRAAPDSNGVEEGFHVLEEIQQADSDTKVVVITGQGQREHALRAIDIGAYDYFNKPIQIDELNVVLRRAIYVHGLEREIKDLQNGGESDTFQGIVGFCPEMQSVFKTIRRVAGSDAGVLITGESGTGKELVARAVHRLSGRAEGGFVAINCGAIPENLLESELFGHEKGPSPERTPDARGGSRWRTRERSFSTRLESCRSRSR